MHDHLRIVGGLYLGWAAVQAVALPVVWLAMDRLQPRGGLLSAAFALVVVLVVAFAVVGAMLWRHFVGALGAARVLAVVALLSFPVGTAVGAYALWALVRRARPAHAGA
jgi:hypothetical protein